MSHCTHWTPVGEECCTCGTVFAHHDLLGPFLCPCPPFPDSEESTTPERTPMQVITESPAKPTEKRVAVELTGLEVALIREALGLTDSEVFTPMAEFLGLGLEEVAECDTDLFLAFGYLGRDLGVTPS